MINFIKEVYIKSFRALRDVKYDNIGLINEIYGKNGCGKTTTIEALNWMLSGETLDYGEKDDGNIDDLNHNELLDVTITMNDGQTFQRKFGYKLQENGEETQVNYFYANDRKCKNQKEYYQYIDSMFGLRFKTEQKLNLRTALINPYKFSLGVDPKILRKFIEELLNIDIDQKLMDTGKYIDIINDYTKNLKNYNYLIESYNKKMKDIDNQINVYNIQTENGKPEYDQIKLADLKTQKLSLQQNYKPFEDAKLHELTLLGNDLTRKLAESQKEDIVNSVSEEEKELNTKINELKTQYNHNVDKYNRLNSNTSILQSKIKYTQQEIEALTSEIVLLRNKKFEIITCPNCHTIINEKGLNEFNEKKANDIKEKEGSLNRRAEELSQYENDFNINTDDTNNLIEIMKTQKLNLSDLKTQLEKLLNDPNKIKKSSKTLELESQIETTKKQYDEQLTQYEINKQKYNDEYNSKLNDLDEEINKMIINYNESLNYQNAIDQKKKLFIEKEELQHKIQVAKDFKKDKIIETKNQIHKIFGDEVDFEFIQEYKTSDNFKEVCYATLKGVKYNSMNTANKLQIGVLIIKKIKEFIGGCALPIIFDISDNIGKQALNNILSNSSSQVFFTCVDRTDESERQLKVLKGIKGE